LSARGDEGMKLIIKRNQKPKTGFFGGHKGMSFVLTCRVELTPEEEELVKKYRAEYYPLIYEIKEGRKTPKYLVRQLINGVTEEADGVEVLLHTEEIIKKACKNFKTLLGVMAKFGGEEVIEF